MFWTLSFDPVWRKLFGCGSDCRCVSIFTPHVRTLKKMKCQKKEHIARANVTVKETGEILEPFLGKLLSNPAAIHVLN